ncbi:hypothetical protein HRR83_009078 [Exophiala dermatitidis]|uniref:Uncharacterized protein n=2 Tax=Exophiala dermatitidis TaxID=5970 RepID=H6BWT6_EXODN|nr:uncharacterized protein HMPREF1120_03420 [Exophiala dermatitidis NIH/UT8656]KAJ4503170.1 hypothetical protein HRR73_009181 [Exophiala dermatitidis]EHY55277.1 hypothetical protein HMPREF1120_03420 [Exophiala dermatitidis NIH/UT8656]KAJ4506161.1 hypothetical protein HRR75_007016 [Exophiala dermatitidis]KAJ4508251.1 hypothetical protein HRR74_007650 [Exophiala dermatitidis]KAJ4533254.1 hypothetical protein HRR77_008785 [Exophiala dermatitidis]
MDDTSNNLDVEGENFTEDPGPRELEEVAGLGIFISPQRRVRPRTASRRAQFSPPLSPPRRSPPITNLVGSMYDTILAQASPVLKAAANQERKSEQTTDEVERRAPPGQDQISPALSQTSGNVVDYFDQGEFQEPQEMAESKESERAQGPLEAQDLHDENTPDQSQPDKIFSELELRARYRELLAERDKLRQQNKELGEQEVDMAKKHQKEKDLLHQQVIEMEALYRSRRQKEAYLEESGEMLHKSYCGNQADLAEMTRKYSELSRTKAALAKELSDMKEAKSKLLEACQAKDEEMAKLNRMVEEVTTCSLQFETMSQVSEQKCEEIRQRVKACHDWVKNVHQEEVQRDQDQVRFCDTRMNALLPKKRRVRHSAASAAARYQTLEAFLNSPGSSVASPLENLVNSPKNATVRHTPPVDRDSIGSNRSSLQFSLHNSPDNILQRTSSIPSGSAGSTPDWFRDALLGLQSAAASPELLNLAVVEHENASPGHSRMSLDVADLKRLINASGLQSSGPQTSPDHILRMLDSPSRPEPLRLQTSSDQTEDEDKVEAGEPISVTDDDESNISMETTETEDGTDYVTSTSPQCMLVQSETGQSDNVPLDRSEARSMNSERHSTGTDKPPSSTDADPEFKEDGVEVASEGQRLPEAGNACADESTSKASINLPQSPGKPTRRVNVLQMTGIGSVGITASSDPLPESSNVAGDRSSGANISGVITPQKTSVKDIVNQFQGLSQIDPSPRREGFGLSSVRAALQSPSNNPNSDKTMTFPLVEDVSSGTQPGTHSLPLENALKGARDQRRTSMSEKARVSAKKLAPIKTKPTALPASTSSPTRSSPLRQSIEPVEETIAEEIMSPISPSVYKDKLAETAATSSAIQYPETPGLRRRSPMSPQQPPLTAVPVLSQDDRREGAHTGAKSRSPSPAGTDSTCFSRSPGMSQSSPGTTHSSPAMSQSSPGTTQSSPGTTLVGSEYSGGSKSREVSFSPETQWDRRSTRSRSSSSSRLAENPPPSSVGSPSERHSQVVKTPVTATRATMFEPRQPVTDIFIVIDDKSESTPDLYDSISKGALKTLSSESAPAGPMSKGSIPNSRLRKGSVSGTTIKAATAPVVSAAKSFANTLGSLGRKALGRVPAEDETDSEAEAGYETVFTPFLGAGWKAESSPATTDQGATSGPTGGNEAEAEAETQADPDPKLEIAESDSDSDDDDDEDEDDDEGGVTISQAESSTPRWQSSPSSTPRSGPPSPSFWSGLGDQGPRLIFVSIVVAYVALALFILIRGPLFSALYLDGDKMTSRGFLHRSQQVINPSRTDSTGPVESWPERGVPGPMDVGIGIDIDIGIDDDTTFPSSAPKIPDTQVPIVEVDGVSMVSTSSPSSSSTAINSVIEPEVHVTCGPSAMPCQGAADHPEPESTAPTYEETRPLPPMTGQTDAAGSSIRTTFNTPLTATDSRSRSGPRPACDSETGGAAATRRGTKTGTATATPGSRIAQTNSLSPHSLAIRSIINRAINLVSQAKGRAVDYRFVFGRNHPLIQIVEEKQQKQQGIPHRLASATITTTTRSSSRDIMTETQTQSQENQSRVWSQTQMEITHDRHHTDTDASTNDSEADTDVVSETSTYPATDPVLVKTKSTPLAPPKPPPTLRRSTMKTGTGPTYWGFVPSIQRRIDIARFDFGIGI